MLHIYLFYYFSISYIMMQHLCVKCSFQIFKARCNRKYVDVITIRVELQVPLRGQVKRDVVIDTSW